MGGRPLEIDQWMKMPPSRTLWKKEKPPMKDTLCRKVVITCPGYRIEKRKKIKKSKKTMNLVVLQICRIYFNRLDMILPKRQ